MGDLLCTDWPWVIYCVECTCDLSSSVKPADTANFLALVFCHPSLVAFCLLQDTQHDGIELLIERSDRSVSDE
jgi:hypothetical protein